MYAKCYKIVKKDIVTLLELNLRALDCLFLICIDYKDNFKTKDVSFFIKKNYSTALNTALGGINQTFFWYVLYVSGH